MFFIFSKLFWLVFAPSHLLLWLVIATAVLIYLKQERAGRWCAIAAAAWFVTIAVLPTGIWLMRPIENQYPRPVWPAHVDGILVLGGSENAHILASRGAINNDETETRLVTGYELARHYPSARLVFSGGSLSRDGRFPQTDVARFVYAQLGLDPRRLMLEDKSRNTWENLVFSKRLAKPQPGETWILVTSAFHLPRAMAIAERVNWKMIPWPADYMTRRRGYAPPFAINTNMHMTDWAIHEWIGLLAYRLAGKAGAAS